jgi:glutathione S-transferase
MRPPGSLPRVSDPLASEAVEDADADTVAAQLAKGPYMLGERLSAADILWGSALTFMSMFKLIPERKEFTDYVARIVARPAAQRAEAKDKELGAKAA